MSASGCHSRAHALADHPLLMMSTAEAASDRMTRYADAWTPARTPRGRPLHRVRRSHGPYIEEVIAIVAEGRLAHLTIEGLTDIYRHQDVVGVPVTGLPPMLVVPVWIAAHGNPMVEAFVRANVADRTDVADADTDADTGDAANGIGEP